MVTVILHDYISSGPGSRSNCGIWWVFLVLLLYDGRSPYPSCWLRFVGIRLCLAMIVIFFITQFVPSSRMVMTILSELNPYMLHLGFNNRLCSTFLPLRSALLLLLVRCTNYPYPDSLLLSLRFWVQSAMSSWLAVCSTSSGLDGPGNSSGNGARSLLSCLLYRRWAH